MKFVIDKRIPMHSKYINLLSDDPNYNRQLFTSLFGEVIVDDRETLLEFIKSEKKFMTSDLEYIYIQHTVGGLNSFYGKPVTNNVEALQSFNMFLVFLQLNIPNDASLELISSIDYSDGIDHDVFFKMNVDVLKHFPTESSFTILVKWFNKTTDDHRWSSVVCIHYIVLYKANIADETF